VRTTIRDPGGAQLRPLLLVGALLLAIGSSARALDLEGKQTLIEYSCDYFGEGGVAFGFVQPPEIKLYQDGTVVFRRDWRYFSSETSGQQLERIRAKLSRSRLLRESTYYTGLRGDPMLHHGGLCHFLYLEDGADSQLIAASVVPRGGQWRRLLEYLSDLLPAAAEPYLPATLVIDVETDCRPPCDGRQWPHADRLDLAATAGRRTEVTDSEVVRTVFLDLRRDFVQADRNYRIEVVAVPGWFEPAKIEGRLLRLVGQ